MCKHAVRRNGGFTLVELLVVIGIIALLISLLLPALNRARIAGQQALCLSNVRQLSIASYNYACDNSGSIVSAYSDTSGTGVDTINGVSGKVVLAWDCETVQQQSMPFGAAYSFERGLLGRYLKTEAVLECPALAALELPARNPGRPKTGYGIGVLIDGNASKFSQIRSPSDTALFGDIISYDPSTPTLISRGTYLNCPIFGTQTIYGDSFHGRHSKGLGVVGFYDGHAEALPAQMRAAFTYNGIGATALAQLHALHIGPVMPHPIDYSQVTNVSSYAAQCLSTYDYYFWVNKGSKN
jgi:prepilin-type N-terminal cleavage/methylation domain-containing protein/prepilin-type processing-associated H-X9-DG protein